MLNTDNWASYPFTVNGIDFVSKLDPEGSFYPQVERLPDGIFANENARAIKELIGNPALLTLKELQDELDRVNAGASQALICLV